MEVLTLNDICMLFIGFIPVGFISCGIPFVVGLTVSGLINIFKKV